ncbi:MAG: lipoate--protein ligase LplA, partial [Flavobacteriales bacterium]|nr:lipoate--protein ligase LplA [Flavobacteriales bacterium]
IQSVRARVTNLCEIDKSLNHGILCAAITNGFFDHYRSQCEIEYIDEDNLPDLPQLESILEKQSSWDWNFGQSPEFTHQLDERFPWGGIDWQLTVKKGQIEQSQLFTDSLTPEPFEWLAKQAINTPYTPTALQDLLVLAKKEYPLNREEWDNIAQLISREVA